MAFTNQAVLSCSKCLCFSRETLQEGNFPLRGCDLAQLGLGEGGKGHAVSCLQRMWTFLRSVRKVGAGAWKGRAALHPGGESWHSALLGGGGRGGRSCVTVMGRAGSWTAPTVGGVPQSSLCCTLLPLGPGHFILLAWTAAAVISFLDPLCQGFTLLISKMRSLARGPPGPLPLPPLTDEGLGFLELL